MGILVQQLCNGSRHALIAECVHVLHLVESYEVLAGHRVPLSEDVIAHRRVWQMECGRELVIRKPPIVNVAMAYGRPRQCGWAWNR